MSDGATEEEPTEREALSLIFSAGYLDDRPETAAALWGTSPGSVARVDRRDEDPFDEGLAIRCPTLVIEGGRDLIVHSDHPARYLSEIRGSRHVLMPDASHGWPMEEPDEFAGIVAGFAREIG